MGDLLISRPVWSVLQTTLDNSVILIVAADSLRGVTGILLNKSDESWPLNEVLCSWMPPSFFANAMLYVVVNEWHGGRLQAKQIHRP